MEDSEKLKCPARLKNIYFDHYSSREELKIPYCIASLVQLELGGNLLSDKCDLCNYNYEKVVVNLRKR